MSGGKRLNKESKFVVFLWVIVSQFVSLLGSAMARFAMGIWVYQDTGQVMSFAMVLVASYLPSVLISPFVGGMIDRKGPRLALAVGGVIGTIALAAGSVVALSTALNFTVVLLLSIALSIVSALEVPALHTITPMLVTNERLSRANGMLASATSTTSVLGPILAGALYGFGTIEWIILLNFITYLVALIVIVVLWKQIARPNDMSKDSGEELTGFFQEMTSGFRYTFTHKALFAMILFHTWLNMSFGINSVIRQPYILGFSTEEQFGLVTSLFGVGMVLGSVFLSLVKVDKRLMTIIFVSNVGMGIAVMLTGFTQQIFFIGFLWVIMGFLLPVGNTLSITLIQRNTDQAYLGRVFSISRMLSWATLPVAYLAGGILADAMIVREMYVTLLGEGELSVYAVLLVLAGFSIIAIVAYYASLSKIRQLEADPLNQTNEQ